MNMKTNDQWFEPGDKVMWVSVTDDPQYPVVRWDDGLESGRVYCVSEFWTDDDRNWINLSGFDAEYSEDGCRVAWFAADFRRVEEIKLCVEAAKKIKTLQPATAGGEG